MNSQMRNGTTTVYITPWQVHYPDGTVQSFLIQDYSTRRLRSPVKEFQKMAENPNLDFSEKEKKAWMNFYLWVKKELQYREMRL